MSLGTLTPEDAVVSTYREHGHAPARGITSEAVMAEMYGTATGCSGGRGGSMHLLDASRRFYGGSAIVAGGDGRRTPSTPATRTPAPRIPGAPGCPLTCRVLGARELSATCVVGLSGLGPTGKREDRHDRRLTLSASSPVPAAKTTARPPTTALLTITEAGCELLAPDTTNGAMTVHTPIPAAAQHIAWVRS